MPQRVGLALDLWMTTLTALWLMLPAYMSNMLPVFVGGGRPIDGGRVWKDGKRVLGDGKTWRGLLLAPLAAAALTFPLQWLAENTAWGAGLGFPAWGPFPAWFVLAFMLGLGALTGDAVESFFKRRTGRDRGDRWFPFDQLDFVVGALVFALLGATLLDLVGLTEGNLFFSLFTWGRLLVIVLLTPALHLLVNFIGYKIGAKDVPW
ncbi:MAG TPA: CDP-2,3-bis-(O-geranylgeranyl)-sn-glycerol synthase [Candidatus Thermoplasmatota archaeon]|nr:CDP-2,3-bis-(O-geranylgeranyl)-sn-glycerol synthase [Candidatus Thermoplasmatota archaeon]